MKREEIKEWLKKDYEKRVLDQYRFFKELLIGYAECMEAYETFCGLLEIYAQLFEDDALRLMRKAEEKY